MLLSLHKRRKGCNVWMGSGRMGDSVSNAVRLVPPNPALLDEYAAALRTGWSPNNEQDMSGEHLAAIAADPAAFLAEFPWAPGKTIKVADGTMRPRLPDATYWIVDDAFCGRINFRHVPGTVDLPPWATGHIGYSIVPWKRRRGIATAALRLMLPIAAAAGLERVFLTTNPHNIPSQKVILGAGGVLDGVLPNGATLGYWIDTGGG